MVAGIKELPSRFGQEALVVLDFAVNALNDPKIPRHRANSWICELNRTARWVLPDDMYGPLSPSTTVAEWHDAVASVERMIEALKLVADTVDGRLAVALEAHIARDQPELAPDAKAARIGAVHRVAGRVEELSHLRDRILARIGQLQGRPDDEALGRLRLRAKEVMNRADLERAHEVSEEQAVDLVREVRREWRTS